MYEILDTVCLIHAVEWLSVALVLTHTKTRKPLYS